MILQKIKRKFKKPRKVVSLRIDEHKCVGCGACVKHCKHEAIILEIEK